MLPWCSSYSFIISPLLFKTVWRRLGIEVYEFLEVLVLEFGPILAWYRFQLLKNLWSSLMYFSFNDAPNVLYRWKIWTGQFSTRTLLLRSHAVVIAAVCGCALSCWNTQVLPWNRHCLEGSICCSKTFIYRSAFIVPSKTCKLPIPYALMHPHTIRDAGFWTECW